MLKNNHRFYTDDKLTKSRLIKSFREKFSAENLAEMEMEANKGVIKFAQLVKEKTNQLENALVASKQVLIRVCEMTKEEKEK